MRRSRRKVGYPITTTREYPSHTRLLRDRLSRDIREAAGYARGDLLDVGCGTRPYEGCFRPHVRRYVGMDRPDTSYDTQRRDAGAHVDIYGDAERLPVADESFDTVVAFQVLEHLPHPWRFILEAARVLSPEGALILTTHQQWHEHDAPCDYFRFTRHGLTSLAMDAGLEVQLLRSQGGGMLMIGTAINEFLTNRYWRMASHPRLCRAVIGLSNRLIRTAERVFPWPQNTANWLMVARKPGAPAEPDASAKKTVSQNRSLEQ